MKVFYLRISDLCQNELRQLQMLEGFDYVFVDNWSGSINLFDRPKGGQIKELIAQKKSAYLEFHSIDRLGRNTVDVLKTWQNLAELGITIVCRNPNLTNYNQDGRTDEVSQMMISILGVMANFEKNIKRQRQLEGITIAKTKGIYKGCKVGAEGTKHKFIAKPRNQKIIGYLGKGYPYAEICKIIGCSFSTINKVKKISNELANNW